MENQDAGDATKIFKIRKTILNMLSDRGYVIEQKLLDESLATFKDKFKGRDSLKPIAAQKKDDESNKILVEFFKNSKNDKKIGVKDIQNFTSKLNQQYIPNGIMIINCPITSLAKQVIYNINQVNL
jgi:DNA-directed RNA polymerase I, II, and III subunit RPABC1